MTTTPPPETPVAGETLEEIAGRITRRWGSQYRTQLNAAILSCLRNERERAALICERGAMLASPVGLIPADDPEHERLQRLVDVLNSAAKAIREGK